MLPERREWLLIWINKSNMLKPSKDSPKGASREVNEIEIKSKKIQLISGYLGVQRRVRGSLILLSKEEDHHPGPGKLMTLSSAFVYGEGLSWPGPNLQGRLRISVRLNLSHFICEAPH